MPCPFFAPEQPLGKGRWAVPPRLPLGEAFSGTCRARAGEFYVAPEAQLRDVCNYGYARGQCDRFPQGDSADAVRFAITAAENGRVTVVYLFEREHAPASHGTLEFLVAEDGFVDPAVDEVLLRQARAFVETYLGSRKER